VGILIATLPTPLRIGLPGGDSSGVVLPPDVHNRGREDMDNREED